MKKKESATLVFDIGKTNKKILVFDNQYKILYSQEKEIPEIYDEDNFPCEDINGLVSWIQDTIKRLLQNNIYGIRRINFSGYGATLVYLDEKGERIGPVYNYLKPVPDGFYDELYSRYGGVIEFSRQTASPPLNMLNAGLQIYWFKRKRKDLWTKVRHILHLPHYFSYLLTGIRVSALPSLGCHTAMWDFEKMDYHPWLSEELSMLPKPVENSTLFQTKIENELILAGTGIHDSSASLVPYLRSSSEKQFVLLSTGTWSINMNPFSQDPLTHEEIEKDCLCYLSPDKQQIKSSRLFLGHIHKINAESLASFYGTENKAYTHVGLNRDLLKKLLSDNRQYFFGEGIPGDYRADLSNLRLFPDFEHAYHQLMLELTQKEAEAVRLVLDREDLTSRIYITGGFVKNTIFCTLLATFFPGKEVYTSELVNASALGAAMVLSEDIDTGDLELNLIKQLPL